MKVKAGLAIVSLCDVTDRAENLTLLADADGLFPVGTYITSVESGVGYTVAPPAWDTSFAAIAAGFGARLDAI